jgi:hypothetical protein
MYLIDVDTDRRVIWITTWGFWTGKTIASFAVEVLTRGTAARIRHGALAVFSDVRAAPIQTSEVSDGTAAVMARGLKLTSAPIVTVAGSMLGKHQSERVLSAPNCRTFLDMKEAHAWLEERWPSAKGGRCPPLPRTVRAA